MEDVYKTIERENDVIKIFDREEVETYYAVPDWSDGQEELAFKYRDSEYFLSQFMNIHNKVYSPNPPEWMLEFDGYLSDSFFSGILIKLIDDETVKAYTYIACA